MSRHACLNRAYRLVWSAVHNLWIPVAETARSRGKSGRVLTLTSLLLAGGAAQALPVGGVVTAGGGNIGQSGSQMTVTQQTGKLAIDWQDFSIGAQESVSFVQPDAGSIALNRVISQNPSQILGALNANGQVFVINPNGVLFGHQAQVSVGALTASTLGLSNTDFMAGNFRFAGTSTAAVSNQGRIETTKGGYIALLGATVNNDGSLVSPSGSVNLAAGDAVTLQLDNGSLVGLTVDKGSLDALVASHGLIQADGGQVLLTAEGADRLSRAVVNHDGVIEARTLENRNGVIRLMGDMESGEVVLDGVLDASAPNGGQGGFIETSAASVKVTDKARVTTKAEAGSTGVWLIDPVDFVVSASGGDISGSQLSTSLNNTGVTIRNTDGVSAGNGDIFINDLVAWSADTTLTLDAERDIRINSDIVADGKSAGLTLNPALGGEGRYSLGAGASITLTGINASLKIGGNAYALIHDIESLQALDGRQLYFALANDIEAAATSGWNLGAGFTPLGTAASPFAGTFDGLGHSILNLTINLPTTSDVGLFARSSGEIRHVHLEKAGIIGTSSTGSLVGVNDGLVQGSSSNGQVLAISNPDIFNLNDIGGLVGLNNGVIAESSSASEVMVIGDAAFTSVANVGGLAGRNSNLVLNSLATGNVSAGLVNGGTVSSVGGLLGLNAGDVDNSGLLNALPVLGGSVLVTASVSPDNNTSTLSQIGGLIGGNDLRAILQDDKNAYSAGKVLVVNETPGGDIRYVGGIAGANSGTLSQALSDQSVTVMGSGISGVGGGVGFSKGALSDIHARGDVTLGSPDVTRVIENAGGLVGENTADLSASDASGLVSVTANGGSAYNIGGLVGYNHGVISGSSARVASGPVPAGAVYSSTASGDVVVLGREGTTVSAVGGQVGSNTGNMDLSGILTDINGGGVTVTSENLISDSSGFQFNIGGLMGQNQGSVRLLGGGRLFSTGPVSIFNPTPGGFISNIGGVVGSNSVSTGLFENVYGELYVKVDNSAGINIFSAGGVAGSNSGTIGAASGYLSIEDVFGGNLDNASYVGGLVGYNSGVIRDSESMSFVQGSAYVGGLVGMNASTGSIKGSYALAFVAPSVKVVGTNGYIGGLVGQNDGTIDTSYFAGEVTGFDGTSSAMGAGGLVGFNSLSGKISNSYAVGSVTGGNVLGGLVGENAGTILNSYASVTVSGVSMLGGLVGNTGASSTVASSFYDMGVTPDDGSSFGRTTDEMMKGDTFSTAGWDIAQDGGSKAVWRIYEGQSMPLLRNFLQALTVTANSHSITYDGSNYAGGNGLSFSTTPNLDTLLGVEVYGGDSQGARHVGLYQISVSGLYSSQQGYDISYQSGTLAIDPKILSVTGVAADKVYDGGVAADVTGVLGGVVSGDSLDLTASGIFEDRNAGTGKQVYATYALSGVDQLNYVLSVDADTLTAAILPKGLSISGSTAQNKVYDGGVSAIVNAGVLEGVIGSDEVLVSGFGAFDNKNAGVGKQVAVGYELLGFDAANYALTGTETVFADITPLSISASIFADSKVYDATTAAVTTGSLSGVLGGDDLSLITSGSFLDKNVGGTKTVNVGYTVSGADAGNYTVMANDQTIADITAREISG
ncbi:MAG: YDG domain-containing protein, partial [Fluviicoccus sp.]|uniref:YDG domain-containing protein n=1 Tax=Fluviicoccus sp. TaxID=2003552 RepID=UPI0027293AB4